MTRQIKIAPSILAADFTRLGEQAHAAASAGDLLHLDVMDGHFVPNISFGPLVIEALRRVTPAFFDVHLMIEKPERYLEAFRKAGADMLTVHVETCPHLHRTLAHIREIGAKAGVALNPHTPLEAIQAVLGDVDRVLVMTVNPGFGGQRIIPATLGKVSRLRAHLHAEGRSVEIAVDGGIDLETASHVVAHGADVLVAGSAVFRPYGTDIATSIHALRTAAAAPRQA